MITEKKFESGKASQESQYTFPYHYIPFYENGHFSQHLFWSWGFRYLGAIELMLSYLSNEKFKSLLDLGCGDGRFLREVNKRFKGKNLLGIDNSTQAINFAKAMNPGSAFKCFDILSTDNFEDKYDIITLVEVLEHIPINLIDEFIFKNHLMQEKGDKIYITVPDENRPLQDKHFQHFNSERLSKIIEQYYGVQSVVFFDCSPGIIASIISRFLKNRLFILNNAYLLNTFFELYLKNSFNCEERDCGRFLLIGIRK